MTPENHLNDNDDQKQHSKRKPRHKDNDKNMKQYQSCKTHYLQTSVLTNLSNLSNLSNLIYNLELRVVLFSKVSHWPDFVSLSNLDQCLVCDRLLLTVILNSALNKIQSNPIQSYLNNFRFIK